MAKRSTATRAPSNSDRRPVEIRFRRPALYPQQLAAIYDPRRYSIIEASTKSGKTAGCICWLAEQALGGRAGQNYWWVAPIYRQAKIAYLRMVRALPRGQFKANASELTITLPTGAMVFFKGADNPDSLYGDDVHAAVVDEASRVKEAAWHAVRSTLTFTRGPVRLIGNVKGRKNWFFLLARRAEAGDPDMGFHRIDARDAVKAGVLDKAEIESAQRDLPEHVFRELYLAIAADDGGNPFGLAHIAACVAPMSAEPVVAWGLDLAKSLDWTVLIGLDAAGRIAYFDRWQAPWRVTIDKVRRIVGTETECLVDSTGVGDPVLEALQAGRSNFTGFKFTSASKQQLMEGLAVAVQQQQTTVLDGVCRLEMESFEYTYSAAGVRYSAPEGYHDDTVCALALAWWRYQHQAVAQPILGLPVSIPSYSHLQTDLNRQKGSA